MLPASENLVIKIHKAQDGFTVFELLVVIAIISVLASVLFPAMAQAKRSAMATVDISNMRQLYAAVVMYESDASDRSPSTIYEVYDYVKSPHVFASPIDIRPKDTHAPGWTVDPCGPQLWPGRSPFRISYPYMRSFMPEDSGSMDSFDYYFERNNPKAGMLASPWVGQAIDWPHDQRDGFDTAASFGPTMSGPIQRIRMDGSYFHLKKRSDDGWFCAGYHDLFFEN